jgi:hypothetical protein
MATKVSKKTEKTVEPKKKVAAKKASCKAPVTIKKPVVKKAPAKKAAAPVIKANADSYIVLDHPVHKETIFGNHYAIRIGASQDGFVEISFNKGEWQPCRYAAGYWWFDWEYFTPGEYTIGVRLVDQGGNTISQTDHRPCTVC